MVTKQQLQVFLTLFGSRTRQMCKLLPERFIIHLQICRARASSAGFKTDLIHISRITYIRNIPRHLKHKMC